MRRLLNGEWYLAQGDVLPEKTEADRMPAEGWIPAAVPGDVNVTLQETGVVPDAKYDTQAQALYFVSSKEWWYKKSFEWDPEEVSGRELDLVFEGLDGTCDVWLNGEFLLHADNAFRPYRCPVREKLRKGENRLAVRFRAIDDLLGSVRFSGQTGWGNRRAFLRKPQFNFGWDWALPVPSLGIWKDVYLEDWDGKLLSCGIRTWMNGRCDFSFEVDPATSEAGYRIVARLDGHGCHQEKTVQRKGRPKCELFLNVEDPKLWYPNGYGEQNLYGYCVELYRDDVLLDRKTGKIGLREVSILEEPFTESAGEGYSFWILVNGMRTFCKGGNWIPTEIWPAVSKTEDYDFAVEKAREANFNMLRIWGGGIYENDRFYERCDEAGIMVWQDFMFAGAGYPIDLLRDNIVEEAEYQIRRLRNHPSIVLWCGINEDCYSWTDNPQSGAGHQADIVQDADTAKWEVDRLHDDPILYTMILRGLVSKMGLGVPYVESSPQARDGMGNRPTSGNCHISCWKYALFETDRKFENYRGHFEQVCSFDSEFCIQGPVSEKYIRSFMKPENHWPPNEAWIYHIQRGHANLPHYVQTMWIAGSTFGEIDSLQKYVKYGSTMHAEHMRSEFDSARHDYPNNGGTMMWMYNDCWPTSNWSIIDYGRNPKPSYYAAKRGCVPYLPILFERGGILDFSFSNHAAKDTEIECRYGIMRLNGEIVRETRKEGMTVKPFETLIFDAWNRAELEFRPDEFLFLEVRADGRNLNAVTYFPNYWKNVPFAPSGLKVRVEKTGMGPDGKWVSDLAVSTDGYARMAHLLYKKDGWFSDNFFDILPGSVRKLTLQTPEKPDPEALTAGDWFDVWE